MAEQNNSLINLGGLAEPAKVLIEKISEAVGGWYRPRQIRRVAQAESDAKKIEALTKIEISALERRALQRFVTEEGDRQKNIEDITAKALPLLLEEAKPEGVQKDWLVDFFDKARLISDEEMQMLWARVLAGEANRPGSYSKRTIQLVAMLDKNDASSLMLLCNYTVNIGSLLVPVILNKDDEIYKKNGLNFAIINHLESIGLITFNLLSNYEIKDRKKPVIATYGKTEIKIEFPEGKTELNLGHALFTTTGEELSRMCTFVQVQSFPEYLKEKWTAEGLVAVVVPD